MCIEMKEWNLAAAIGVLHHQVACQVKNIFVRFSVSQIVLPVCLKIENYDWLHGQELNLAHKLESEHRHWFYFLGQVGPTQR
jgi:hypothetical protein